MPKKPPTRTKVPLMPERVQPVTGKAQARKLPPGAIIYGVPQLNNGSRDHDPEPVMRGWKVDISANEFSENSRDRVFSRAAAAVSESLLQQVTMLFKRLFKFHYESAEEIAPSPEWQEMNRLFCYAVDTYVNIAMNNLQIQQHMRLGSHESSSNRPGRK